MPTWRLNSAVRKEIHPSTQNDSIGGKHNSRYVADAREEILSISITTDSANKHSAMAVHVIGIQAFAQSSFTYFTYTNFILQNRDPSR